ncbi:probable glucan endo-1,3-beta-glucosidase A6 [Olea europaea subsp. europaea]|uniref:Probable glucan endo-1,3-beta-glucosidase A6 n=1 Tax=Olea europaea subsp. europaea TaxID=158383 RepID=A0A8S0TRA9_OLEEU|nr:probable glucan endo-1,3-beta-glucosidase A6 [Olea europaea subsp. europaea]
MNADQVKIYDASPEVLKLLSGMSFQVSVMVTNDIISGIALNQLINGCLILLFSLCKNLGLKTSGLGYEKQAGLMENKNSKPGTKRHLEMLNPNGTPIYEPYLTGVRPGDDYPQL